MTRPLLSILIPTYNRADLTFEAVKSVGVVDDVEIVVVDDCSDIEEYKAILQWQPLFSNMVLYRNHENIGMTRNFNRCMEYAQGQWFSLIGSDDYYKPDAIAHMLDLLRNDIAKDPALIVYSRTDRSFIVRPGPNLVRSMKLPSGSGDIWHSSIYEDLGGFDERLTFSPDTEYWYRIATKYPVIFIAEKFSVYREHETNIMWSMWRKRDEMIRQVKLVTLLNMKHRGEDTTDEDVVSASQSIAVWDMLSYVLRKTANMPDKQDIFTDYLERADRMAVTQDRKNLINGILKAKEAKIAE